MVIAYDASSKKLGIKMFKKILLVTLFVMSIPSFGFASTNTTNAILAQQIALGHWSEIEANDMANVSTDGYEGKNVVFSQFEVYFDGNQESNMVEDFGVYRDTKVGTVERTNNDFDFALISKGDYFAIQTADGVRYTRKSHYLLDGILKDDQGNGLLSLDGGEIAIPEGSLITVDAKGRIFNQFGEFISQLQVVNFGEEIQKLKEEAGPYYMAENIPVIPSENPLIQHRHILNSNVKAHEKMSEMMRVSKLFQNGNNILKLDEQQAHLVTELINY